MCIFPNFYCKMKENVYFFHLFYFMAIFYLPKLIFHEFSPGQQLLFASRIVSKNNHRRRNALNLYQPEILRRRNVAFHLA